MAYSDAELIRRTLAGDETAFGFLVDKYKGAVHALAYRKLGDFHTAEEITQDTFLKAYQKLGTLKDLQSFPGWLYVIAARCCISWQRKNRLPTLSLDDVGAEMDSLATVKYVDQKSRERVHDALESLPESDRTVLTLHYLAGMTCEEISRFLGTSRGAVLDRLYRARCHLKEEMIDMMEETLGTFQLSPTLTQRLMEQIRYLKPTAASEGSKPLAPWIAGATVAVMALLVGIGLMQTQRFQRPYSLDALESATMVELTDAPIIDLPIQKQSLANRVGQSNAGNAGNGNLSSGDVLALTADAQGDKKSGEIVWAPTNGPYGGSIYFLSVTPSGTFYAGTSGGLFRSTSGADSWQLVGDGTLSGPNLFAVSGETLYAGYRGGDDPQSRDGGIFRSTDGGKTWARINAGLKTRNITALAVVGSKVYAGTWKGGVYRLATGQDVWMPVNDGLEYQNIKLLLVMDTTLYAITQGYPNPDIWTKENGIFRLEDGREVWEKLEVDLERIESAVTAGKMLYAVTHRGIFRWESPNAWGFTGFVPHLRPSAPTALATIGDTLYLGSWGENSLFQSTDQGKSWTPVGVGSAPPNIEKLAVSGTILLAATNDDGIYRSTDGGEIWTRASTGLTGLNIEALAMVGRTLYAGTRFGGVFYSEDEGKSWTAINDGLTNRNIEAFAVLGTRLYVGNWGFDPSPMSVYYLEEGQKSWKPADLGLTNPKVNTLAVMDNRLYAGTYGGGVFRLNENANSWESIGLDNAQIRQLIASENDLYALVELGGIFRLKKAEGDWEAIDAELPSNRVSALAIVDNLLYASVSKHGVLRLSETENQWIPINDGIPPLRLVLSESGNVGTFSENGVPILVVSIVSASRTALYASVPKHGIFRLVAGKDAWEPINTGLGNRNISTLLVSGDTLYAGTLYGAVYRASLKK